MHGSPHLSAASTGKGLPLLARIPAELAQLHRGVPESVSAFDPALDDHPAFDTGAGQRNLSV
jgi:hypothetical protein